MVSLSFVAYFGAVSLGGLEEIGLDENQKSWLVSIDMMLALIFAPLGGKLAELIGVKLTFLLCSPLVILGFVLVGLNLSTMGLFAGRILNGVGVSILMVLPSVYIAETSHPDGRSTLASLIGFGTSIGICILLFLGYFFDWQTVAILSTVPSIVSFTGFLFLPETPYWLINQKQKFEEALASLKFFRKNKSDSEIALEFKEISEHYLQKAQDQQDNIFQHFCSPAFKRAFLCIGVLYPLHECTCVFVTVNYLEPLMIESNIELEPKTCAAILGLARLGSAILTLTKMQTLPPKSTFVILCATQSVALATAGTFYLLQDATKTEVQTWNWIPLAMFAITFACRAFNMSLIWTLIGEMFPSESRNFASGILVCSSFVVIGTFLKFFYNMKNAMGFHGVLFLYAGFGALATIYGALTIPDNRSKSLVEIEKNHCRTPLLSNEMNKG